MTRILLKEGSGIKPETVHTETTIAPLSSITNDEEPHVGDATGARDVPGGSGE
jgi:hypothetical protein